VSTLGNQVHAALWWVLPLAGLGAVIGWETDWGRALETHPPPAEAIAPKPVVTSLLPEFTIEGGVAARAETVQRTLFNPTRRPAPPAVQEAAAMRMQRGQFALTGTMIVDGKSTAFLREVAGGKARRVQTGEKINGLLVAEVKPDRVKFTLGDESEELVLKVAVNPRPTAPPATVAQAGTPPPGVAPPPAPTGTTTDAAQTLAERRRAARAAAAVPPAASPAAAAGAPAVSPAAAGAPAASAPVGGLDPRWEQMDQRYREQTATGNRGVAK
jgi:hypothetical protein